MSKKPFPEADRQRLPYQRGRYFRPSQDSMAEAMVSVLGPYARDELKLSEIKEKANERLA